MDISEWEKLCFVSQGKTDKGKSSTTTPSLLLAMKDDERIKRARLGFDEQMDTELFNQQKLICLVESLKGEKNLLKLYITVQK